MLNITKKEKNPWPVAKTRSARIESRYDSTSSHFRILYPHPSLYKRHISHSKNNQTVPNLTQSVRVGSAAFKKSEWWESVAYIVPRTNKAARHQLVRLKRKTNYHSWICSERQWVFSSMAMSWEAMSILDTAKMIRLESGTRCVTVFSSPLGFSCRGIALAAPVLSLSLLVDSAEWSTRLGNHTPYYQIIPSCVLRILRNIDWYWLRIVWYTHRCWMRDGSLDPFILDGKVNYAAD